MVAGVINNQLLDNLHYHNVDECSEVRVIVPYISHDKLDFFETCKKHDKPTTLLARYDESVPVAPEIIKWFLDTSSPNFICKVVPDVLHAKVIWWVGRGAYIGSANLTSNGWHRNIEAGLFVPEEELTNSPLGDELLELFEFTEARAESISREFYRHLLDLEKGNAEIERQTRSARNALVAHRFFPRAFGLTDLTGLASADAAYIEFERNWRSALQYLRDIGERVSLDVNRPSWIDASIPKGAQADQFLHAYYYKVVRGNINTEQVEKFYEQHRGNPELALQHAIDWWKNAEFDYENERDMLFNKAPRIRALLDKGRVLGLSKDEFVTALSLVHAVGDYASKRVNAELGLPSTQQDGATKTRLHLEQLWDQRSQGGHTPLELLHHVIWGGGPIEKRIWAAARSHKWKMRWVQFSTLGETVGWARPDEFPPRNDRTIKGLRALGYSVRRA